MQARAQRVQCMANSRSLYAAAEMYIQQNGNWPQIPCRWTILIRGTSVYAKNWIAALSPFGPTQKTWICPTIQGLHSEAGPNESGKYARRLSRDFI